jgi:glycosyltransferase involved in cell wall biosynthesis
VDAICEAIEKLYKNRDLAREMGIGARKYVAQYTWENYSSELARHYRTITGDRSDSQA